MLTHILSFSNPERKLRQRGGTIIEFAFVVPVLVVFAIGIIELGQLLSQAPVLLNTSYLVATYQGGFSQDGTTLAQTLLSPAAKSQKFVEGFDPDLHLAINSDQHVVSDTSDDTLIVNIHPNLSSLWSSGKLLGITSRIVGPLGGNDPGTVGNGYAYDGYYRDCNGNPVSSPVTTTCVTPEPPPPPPSGGGGYGSGGNYCTSNCGGGSCFLKGTLISLSDGTRKPIEELKIGDEVLAFDEVTDAIKPSKIVETFVHDNAEFPVVIINGTLRATSNHPMYVRKKGNGSGFRSILSFISGFLPKGPTYLTLEPGLFNRSDHLGDWVEAGRVKIGDSLLSQKGEKVLVRTLEAFTENTKVFNLEVVPFHTYIAEGLVVHNKAAAETSVNAQAEQPPM